MTGGHQKLLNRYPDTTCATLKNLLRVELVGNKYLQLSTFDRHETS